MHRCLLAVMRKSAWLTACLTAGSLQWKRAIRICSARTQFPSSRGVSVREGVVRLVLCGVRQLFAQVLRTRPLVETCA